MLTRAHKRLLKKSFSCKTFAGKFVPILSTSLAVKINWVLKLRETGKIRCSLSKFISKANRRFTINNSQLTISSKSFSSQLDQRLSIHNCIPILAPFSYFLYPCFSNSPVIFTLQRRRARPCPIKTLVCALEDGNHARWLASSSTITVEPILKRPISAPRGKMGAISSE
jgi:hypothetical protein